jgi:hypothetical protein
MAAQGWVVEHNGRHLCAKSPGGSVVFLAATPSDRRAYANNLALLRRHGLQVPR